MLIEIRIKMIYIAVKRKIEAAWIICGPRLVQTQAALSEDVVNYLELRAA